VAKAASEKRNTTRKSDVSGENAPAFAGLDMASLKKAPPNILYHYCHFERGHMGFRIQSFERPS
jgi:hypothetical protein